MKFIKTFEELNLGTYANAMDNTENYPTAGFMASGDAKKRANKMARVNGLANARFQEEFFKLYPKVETKIYFEDRQATYELKLYDIKFNTNYTNYDLIFKTESGHNVWIKNPYYIDKIDIEKISLLPVEITPESKELVNKMFDYGLSGDKIVK
jgi:hypothetical protein